MEELRKELIEEVIKELCGPRFGSDELIDFDPWGEYFSGLIIPKSWENDAQLGDINPDAEILTEEDVTTEDSSDISTNLSSTNSSKLDARSQPKSFGISFFVDSENPKFDICVTWGRYFNEYNDEDIVYNLKGETTEVSDFIKNNEKIDDSSKLWKRYSYGKIIKDLVVNKNILELDLNDDNDGFIKLYIKRIPIEENRYRISVYVINDLKYNQDKKDYHPNTDKCLFQPSIRINCKDNVKLLNIEMLNDSNNELNFLYRNKPVIASGHMCSAVWKEIDYIEDFNKDVLWIDGSIQKEKNKDFEDFESPDIRSEFVPLYPTNLPSFDINGIKFSAKELSEYSPQELYDSLFKLIDSYNDWINDNKNDFKNLDDIYTETAKNIISNQETAYKRMKRGIDLIRDEKLVYLAFCFANKTISLQNEWKGKEDFKWRPFQLAFVIMSLESIFYEDSSYKNILDLLWIPTGGGKTEAYLGIMAFTMALRRLKAYKNNESGAGTAIISRYTLRLLTVQQFRRTLKMVTAAEMLRVQKTSKGIGWRPSCSDLEGDWIYGSTRFSTGMWVGGAVSPIHLNASSRKEYDGAISILKNEDPHFKSSHGEPAQIIKCPVCGSWISVPESGLNDEINKIHIVIKTSLANTIIKQRIKNFIDNTEKVEFLDISKEGLKEDYYTVSFKFEGFTSREKISELMQFLDYEFKIASLGHFNFGYFTSLSKIDRRQPNDFDFELWCTNPKCHLNNSEDYEWMEGVPFEDNSFKFPDGNYKRTIESPFIEKSRIPIPAYVVDDHVYHRCPTVVISTADKIARLAFEPRASGIFGNINKYNKYYGFARDDLFLRGSTDTSKTEEYTNDIPSFEAPNLIIQDELHLIEGPLGSLFGLYEAMVSAIIKKQGGNPKYIASTATINNAEKQVNLLFSKDVFQFPPHGLDISNSFFVKDEFDDLWSEKNRGRIYLGMYAPGKGPITPQIRLWSRLIKSSYDRKDYEFIKNYWTTVGYFNSIKELGGMVAIYRDDIKFRLKRISGEDSRILEDDKIEELSSRKDSTYLPLLLDKLERDGISMPSYDAIFTTSMFGTGVDIPHLSLMVMASQPKTTGSYIQATGRIGRNHGGLVVDLLKSGRPRDLNHYEMFTSYHSRIYMGVEPVSISPFSKGCLSRGLGSSTISFLRNASNLENNWYVKDASVILRNESTEDLKFIRKFLEDRLNNMNEINSEDLSQEIIDYVLNYLDNQMDKWERIAEDIEESGEDLKYVEYRKTEHNVVLGDPSHEYNPTVEVIYKNAPQSLRDIEETIGFWV